ncbi:MAG: glycosyltransferase [Smithella sp.]|jgi:glycosyltransferase involved in cell wall biosynthesis|nr:glycosyltransferase [Smithella sp.]
MSTGERPVSVTIPAYNVARWLPELFAGLDSQTFRSFETIFVNDGSTDDTGRLLEEYALSRKGVKVLHQANAGVSAARNTGVDAASGTYVVFIDGDDTVGPAYLSDLVDLATKHDLDFGVCNGCRFRERPGDMDGHFLIVLPKSEEPKTGVEWMEAALAGGEWCGYVYMNIIRRELLCRHQIRFAEDITCHEDLLWNAMVQPKAARMAYAPKYNYYYRYVPDSIINDKSLKNRLRRIDAYRMVIEYLWKLAEAEAPRVSAVMKRLAVEHGRIFLGMIAQTGSLRQRLAIYAELRKTGFLARLFRDTGQSGHLKRIVRAWAYGLAGPLAGPSSLTEEAGGQRTVRSDK